MDWKSSSVPNWGCFLLAAITLILGIIWRTHDKGVALWSGNWNGLSVFAPACFIAVIILAAAIVNYKAHHVSFRNSPELPREESKLKIHRAVWGDTHGKQVDVTANLATAAKDYLVLDVYYKNPLLGDPSPQKLKRLDIEYSYGSEIVKSSIFRWERRGDTDLSRLVLPEDSIIDKLRQELSHTQASYSREKEQLLDEKAKVGNEKLQLEADLRAFTSSLESRTFAMCREIRAFIREVGPRPTIDYRGKEDQNALSEFMRSGKYLEWKNRFESGYRKRFAQRLVDLRNELQERGQQDNEVDLYVLGHGEFIADTGWLETLVNDLVVMAGNLL